MDVNKAAVSVAEMAQHGRVVPAAILSTDRINVPTSGLRRGDEATVLHRGTSSDLLAGETTQLWDRRSPRAVLRPAKCHRAEEDKPSATESQPGESGRSCRPARRLAGVGTDDRHQCPGQCGGEGTLPLWSQRHGPGRVVAERFPSPASAGIGAIMWANNSDYLPSQAFSLSLCCHIRGDKR